MEGLYFLQNIFWILTECQHNLMRCLQVEAEVLENSAEISSSCIYKKRKAVQRPGNFMDFASGLGLAMTYGFCPYVGANFVQGCRCSGRASSSIYHREDYGEHGLSHRIFAGFYQTRSLRFFCQFPWESSLRSSR